MSDAYQPPRVWTPPANSPGLNRDTAGARAEVELPVGQHPLQLYSMATPNGVKVTILLEELLAAGHPGAEYDAWPIRIGEGDQFGSGFVGINPNSKIPALLDRSGAEPVRLFESGSILLYLAEKFGAFLPAAQRTETLNWLFWQMGSAPFLGGGFGHFYVYATEKLEYPINRYAMEARRQLDVLNRQLADHPFIAGREYSIADIAIWPWYGALVRGEIYDSAAEYLSVQEYSHLRRWSDEIATRPAVQRGRRVNKIWGDGAEQVPERHSAADLD